MLSCLFFHHTNRYYDVWSPVSRWVCVSVRIVIFRFILTNMEENTDKVVIKLSFKRHVYTKTQSSFRRLIKVLNNIAKGCNFDVGSKITHSFLDHVERWIHHGLLPASALLSLHVHTRLFFSFFPFFLFSILFFFFWIAITWRMLQARSEVVLSMLSRQSLRGFHGPAVPELALWPAACLCTWLLRPLSGLSDNITNWPSVCWLSWHLHTFRCEERLQQWTVDISK